MIGIDETGRIRWASRHARQLLKKYCGSLAEESSLPDRLQSWLRSKGSSTVGYGIRPGALPLAIRKGSRQLVVSHVRESGQRLLLLEEGRLSPVVLSVDSLGLTKREMEVLRWVAQGKSNGDIGIILECSARTVQKHLERIYIKLGVETRTAAAARALELMWAKAGNV
ncbi:helix-turn-helix domain-containing protein [Candidatus Nitrospira bockiana]